MTNILEESLLLSDYTFGFELEAIIKNNSSFYNDVINENLNKNDLNFKERLNENNQNEIIIGYHGTNNNFDEFDSKYRRISTFGQGFYFVNSEDEANEYGDIIIKAALTMKNPLIIKDVFIGNEDVLEPIGIKKMSHLNSDDSLEKIKKAGYDSIIVLNAEGKRNLKYYIVFDNSQIKIMSKLYNINESFVMDYDSEKPIIYYTHSDSEAKRMINTLLSKNPIRGLYDFVNKVYLLGDAYEVIHYDLIDKTNRYGNTKFKYPTDDREIYQYLDKTCAMFKIIDENDYKSFSKSDGYKYAYIGKLDNNQYIICRNNELAPSHYNAPDELKKIQQVPLFQNIKFVNYDVRERITKDTMPQKLVDESIHYAKQFKNNYGENSLFTIEKNPTKQEFWSLLKNSTSKKLRGICVLEPNQIKSVKNVGTWNPNSNNIFENNTKNLNNILLNEKSYSEKALQTINHNKERYGLSLYGSFEEQLYEAYLITNRKYAEDIREEYLNNIEEYISDHTNIDVYEESENLGITEEEWYAEYAEKYVPNVDTILDDEWHNEPDLNEANKLLNNARLKYIDDVYNFINKLCKENNYELNKVESRQSDSTYFEIYQIKTNLDGYEEIINEYKIRISDHKSPQSSRKYGYNDLDYNFGTNIDDIIKDIQKLMQGNVLKESEDIGIVNVHDKIKKKLDDILNEGINDKLPNNSHITIDMSVKPDTQEKEYNKQDISFEYNSPVIPCKPIWFAKVIKFLSDIKKQGIYTNSSCGFHHHLSFNLQNERDIIWIYCNMASDPEFFEEITKLDNTYNLTDDKYAELGTMVQLGEDILNKDYDKILEKLTTDKYRLFRIHPQGTLEWRGPRGFLNNATIDIIKDFYKLFIKLITKTKSYLDSNILIGTNINKEEFFNGLLLAKKRTNNNIKLEFLSLPTDDEYKEGNIKFKSNEKYNKQSIEKIVNKIKQNPNILYNIILNQPKIIIDIYNVIGKMNFIQLVLNIKNDNIFNQMNVRKKEKITNTIENVLLLNNININEIESIFSMNLLNLNNNEYELEEKINQLIKNNTINETNLYNIIMQSIYDQRKLYLNKLLKLLFSNNLLEKFNEEKLLSILLKICGNSKIINKIWDFQIDSEIIYLKIIIKRYKFEDNWDSIIYKALNGNHAILIKLLVKYNIPILRYLISFNPEYYKYLPKRVQEQIIKE